MNLKSHLAEFHRALNKKVTPNTKCCSLKKIYIFFTIIWLSIVTSVTLIYKNNGASSVYLKMFYCYLLLASLRLKQ